MDAILSKTALKELQALPLPEKKKVYKKLQMLKTEPFVGKKLTGELSNVRSFRVWPYRILYEVNTDLHRVEIIKIAHRKHVYQ